MRVSPASFCADRFPDTSGRRDQRGARVVVSEVTGEASHRGVVEVKSNDERCYDVLVGPSQGAG